MLYQLVFLFSAISLLQEGNALSIDNLQLKAETPTSVTLTWKLTPPQTTMYTVDLTCVNKNKRKEKLLNFVGFNADELSLNWLSPNTLYECTVTIHFFSSQKLSKTMTVRTSNGVICQQPVGFENHAVKDIQITVPNAQDLSETRLNNVERWCTQFHTDNMYMEIDLGSVITVTGIAFQGHAYNKTKDIQRGINLQYKIEPSEKWVPVRQSNKPKMFYYPEMKRTFRNWFSPNATFSARFLRFDGIIQAEDKQFCLQLEVYGCSQICHSWLQPIIVRDQQLSNNMTNNVANPEVYSDTLWCPTKTNTLQFDFGQVFTVSGVMLQSFNNVSDTVEFSLRYVLPNNSQSRRYVHKNFSANFLDGNVVTFWLDVMVLSRHFELIPKTTSCLKVTFLGCPSDEMNKLGIEKNTGDVRITASSSFEDQGEITANNKPTTSLLNALQTDWTQKQDDTSPWLQACLASIHVVTAIVLQGQGYQSAGFIPSYSIKYGYSAKKLFDYKIQRNVLVFDGPTGRYETTVNVLPVKLTATCIRIYNMGCHRNCSGRWELLGSFEGEQPTISPINPLSLTKTVNTTISTVVIGQPGVTIEWYYWGSRISVQASDYEIETHHTTGNMTMTYKSTLNISAASNFMINADYCDVLGNTSDVHCHKQYTVQASYEKCNGTFSEESVVVTVTGFDGHVDIPTITITTTNTSMFAMWGHNKTDFQLFFNVTISSENETVLLRNVSTAHFLEMTNLMPYSIHLLEVQVYNALNVSSEVVKESFRTQEGFPSKVLNMSLRAISKESIHLSWSLPETVNGIVTNYTLQYARQHEYNFTVISLPALGLLYNGYFTTLISDLDNFEVYKFRIKALTNRGFNPGPWSDWSLEKTWEGTPTAPRNLTVQSQSPRTIYVKWAKPEKLNGLLKHYTVSYTGLKSYNTSFTHTGEVTLNSTSVLLDALYPGTVYKVVVRADNRLERGEHGDKLDITLPFVEPRKPVIHSKTSSDLETKTFDIFPVPSDTGPVSHYEVYVFRNTTDCEEKQPSVELSLAPLDGSNQVPFPVNIKKGIESITISKQRVALDLLGLFVLCSRAVISGPGTTLNGSFASAIFYRNDLKQLDRNDLEIHDTSISLRLSQGPATTRFYQIIVAVATAGNLPTNITALLPFDASLESQVYVAAEFTASMFPQMRHFVVGDGETFNQESRICRSGNEYVNAELVPGKAYSVMQRGIGDKCSALFSTPWLRDIKTLQPIAPLPTAPVKQTVTGKSKGNLIASIAGGLGAAVVLGLLTAVFLVMRRNRSQRFLKKTLDASEMIAVNSKLNESVDDEEDSITTVESPFASKVPPETIERHRVYVPIKVEDFTENWSNSSMRSTLAEEFKALRSGQQYSWNAAIKPEVKIKNRYGNIVAYDHSRVCLHPPTDYINASYIHGYTRKNMYIASQGPNKSSVNDFWTMVWEKNVPAVVMVTKLTEKYKVKCERYWPEHGTGVYGPFEITLSVTHSFTDYAIRKFLIKKTGFQEKRVILHYQYLSWPDHGVPEFPSDIVNFRQRFRKVFPVASTANPVVIHCSAGVGRTGTFIVIDSMLELARQNHVVDVFNFVNFIRSRRIHMVQTEEQYLFVYKALFDHFICGETEFLANQFNAEKTRLLALNAAGVSHMEVLLNKLSLVTPSTMPAEETMEALKVVNQVKNRNAKILPRDDNKVLLLDAIDGDYINAVFVNGYCKRNEYIVTQFPMVETLVDFWLMVVQKDIETIIWLADFDQEENMSPLFPPLNTSVTYRHIHVASERQETAGNILITKLSVVNAKTENSRSSVNILQIKWLEGTTPTPDDVLALFTKMEVFQAKQQKVSPVVVMCRDGGSRSGTFLSIAVLIQQLQLEQMVDVVQTVRKMRTARSQFVDNLQHFHFCYDVVSAYIASFDIYSNFEQRRV